MSGTHNERAKTERGWEPVIHVSESGQAVDDLYPDEVHEYVRVEDTRTNATDACQHQAHVRCVRGCVCWCDRCEQARGLRKDFGLAVDQMRIACSAIVAHPADAEGHVAIATEGLNVVRELMKLWLMQS
jgi:hypothetical protein